MTSILVIGAVCVVAAIVGGELKLAGFEFPILTSRTSRVLLAGVGIVFVIIGLFQPFTNAGRTPPVSTPTRTPPGSESPSPTPPTPTATAPTVPPSPTTKPTIVIPAVYLADLQPAENTSPWETGTISFGGKTFIKSMTLRPIGVGDTPEVDYDIDSGLNFFTCTLGMRDEAKGANTDVYIYGDNELLTTGPVHIMSGKVVPIRIRIAGHQLLRLIAHKDNNAEDALFGSAELEP